MNDRTTDRIAVHDVMHRYALAIDTRRWDALTDLFTSEVTADFRTFGAKTVYRGTAQGWVDRMTETLAGMDATHHAMTNHLYEIDGDRARGTTYLRARHVCRNDWGGDSYTVGGHYAVEMVRTGQGWRITSYTLHVTWHAGDRHVLRAAARRASER